MPRASCARLVLALLLATVPASAGAQTSDDWRVAIYPVLAWVPLGIEIDVSLPPGDGDGGFAGEIVDSRLDGAFVGGLSLQKGPWRLDADGVWAAVGGDRLELPRLTVDADLIYFHISGGRKLVGDLFVTGGLRRLALKYDIEVGDLPNFERKPGVWDPLVGAGWHRLGNRFETHATFEVGGFGAGADVEVATSFRADWKPFTHFGLTVGYQWLYFKVEDSVRDRPFRVEQTLHGPLVGIGLYF